VTHLRLLVVEDSAEDALLIAREVARTWPALEWRRVEDAEALADALDGRWDAIVASSTLDVSEALRLVRTHGWDGPFIVVSGEVEEETTVAAMRAGAHDYVMKGNLRRLGPALERELAEARLRERSREAGWRLIGAERLYSRVARQLPGLVWTTDARLRVTSAAGAALASTPLPVDGLVGSEVDELAATIALFHPLQHRSALGGEHVRFDASWAGHDYLVRIEPLLDEAGRAEGCIGVALDLTERRAAEQALRESEARFRALIENSIDVTTILLADGTIRYASPSAERVLGYRPEELVGRNAFELVHPDDAPEIMATFRSAALDPAAIETDSFRARHSDGTWRVMEAVGLNLLRDPAVRGMVVTSRDITARRALEERLSQSERLEAIGQLAGGIAHDFNNVLLVIRGYSTVLRAGLSDPQQIADIDEIGKAADRAANLTRQLLAFGRRQVLQQRLLSIPDVVRDLESLLRRAVPERIDVRSELVDDAPPVVADPAQIEQMLLNLVVNSRDAIEEAGTITIRVGGVELARPDGTATPPLPAGRYATLAVRDTGCGIPGEALPHVFEPFFTTKDEGSGTGLGLSTVYGIVTQSGGSIAVSTAHDVGTEIVLYLPAAADSAAVERVAGDPRKSIERGSERVLLVEDEEPVRELVRRVLESAGYSVHASRLPSDALAVLASGAQFDLLISDVVMPEMSGYELATRVQREHPGVRTLFISGYAHEAAQAAEPLGGERVLLKKPFAPDELARTVRAVLDDSAVAAA
jgi:two-component system cell cycle sensor histidine kinase/response regulator CckA